MTFFQIPLDCSFQLLPSFTNPYPSGLKYNSFGSFVEIATSYESVFTDSKNTDCPMTECRILDPDCFSPLFAQTHVILEPINNFKLIAKETFSPGYTVDLCY